MTPDPSPSPERLRGVLLGTALGDALGLPLEGMSAAAIHRRFGWVTRFRLLGSWGFVSDDTEQSALVAAALGTHPDDLSAATRAFRWSLLGWFARLPFGIGLATIRACLRMLLGLKTSGVASAGNGAAMRAAVIGVRFSAAADTRRAFSDAFARVTHTDPRAVEGARYVAELAAACARSSAQTDLTQRCREAMACVDNAELRTALDAALALAGARAPVADAVQTLGATGYVVHTLAFATYAFARFGASPTECLFQTVNAGGDTDSIGAIVGAWVGALHGAPALPVDLLHRIHDGPFGPSHLTALADRLAAPDARTRPVSYSWVGALVRNLALYPVVLAHGFRRLLPF